MKIFEVSTARNQLAMGVAKTDSCVIKTRPDDQQVENTSEQIVKPSLRRFIILILFCLTGGNKSFQWIQISSVTMKATIFYGVENYMINLSSILFMLAFVFVSWPACFLVQRIGIRKAILISCCGTFVGSCIKACSWYYNSIELLLAGQVVIALSEQLVHPTPPRLASIWFPDNEVSSCIAICLFGNQIGVALGFLIPQWLMRDAFTSYEIGVGFFRLYFGTLIYSTVLLFVNWILFDEAPTHAPGLARRRQMAIEKETREAAAAADSSRGAGGGVSQLWTQIRDLLKNRDFVLMSLCSGLGNGRCEAMSTLMDQMIKPLYPDNATLVGNVGSLVILAGAFGTPIWGRILDQTKAFKTVNLTLAACMVPTLVGFIYVLLYTKSICLIYIFISLFGLFQTGQLASGMAFAIELTYPASEMVVSSIMYITPAIFGSLFTLIGSYLVDTYGALETNIFFLTTVAATLLCIICCRERLKRQEAILSQEKKLAV